MNSAEIFTFASSVARMNAEAIRSPIAYNDESEAAQIIRLKRRIAALEERENHFRQVLITIAEMPYDEKDQDEDGRWNSVSDGDAQDYLQKAVECALNAFSAGKP